MSEELPVVDGNAPLQPVRDMPFSSPRVPAKTTPLLSVVDAIVEAIDAAYAEGRRTASEATAITCWHIGEAVEPIREQFESIQKLYHFLKPYAPNIGSRTAFYQSINAYKEWPQGLPGGYGMKEVKSISIANDAMPVEQEKPKKVKINAPAIHGYVLDKVGQFWSRGDLQAIEGFLGIQVVDAVAVDAEAGALEGGMTA